MLGTSRYTDLTRLRKCYDTTFRFFSHLQPKEGLKSLWWESKQIFNVPSVSSFVVGRAQMQLDFWKFCLQIGFEYFWSSELFWIQCALKSRIFSMVLTCTQVQMKLQHFVNNLLNQRFLQHDGFGSFSATIEIAHIETIPESTTCRHQNNPHQQEQKEFRHKLRPTWTIPKKLHPLSCWHWLVSCYPLLNF